MHEGGWLARLGKGHMAVPAYKGSLAQANKGCLQLSSPIQKQRQNSKLLGSGSLIPSSRDAQEEGMNGEG
eukprot:scaffold105226_cov18-Tisochrysis_lutea.AAC.4